jgi:hypothetical protein
VLFWFSPFPLAAAVEAHLRAAGMEPYREPLNALPQEALLLYQPPHALLALDGSSCDPQVWLAGYDQLLGLAPQHRSVALWRLQAMTPEAIAAWLTNGHGDGLSPAAESMDPLAALITCQLLQAHPQLLEAYLDLELQSDLVGGTADSEYLARLRAGCSVEALLGKLKVASSERESLAAQAKEAQEEAELTLLQLHRVQKELEQVFLTSLENEQKLLANQENLSRCRKAREQLQVELKDARAELRVASSDRESVAAQAKEAQEENEQKLLAQEEELSSCKKTEEQLQAELRDARAELRVASSDRESVAAQAKEAQEEAELTLLQLHQVQEELEHVFLASQENEQKLLANQENLSRCRKAREQLQAELRDARAELRVASSDRESVAAQAKEAQEKAELTLLQLNQVQERLEQVFLASQENEQKLLANQEELEHYRLLSREQQLMIERQNKVSSQALELAAAMA